MRKRLIAFLIAALIALSVQLFSDPLIDPEDRLPSSIDKVIQSGEFIQAEKLLLSLINDPHSDPVTKPHFLILLSRVYWDLGKIDLSLSYAQKAYQYLSSNSQQNDLLTLSKNIIEIINFYNNGKVLTSEGKYQDAIQAFQKAIDIASKFNMLSFEAKCKRLLSITYFNLKDYQSFYKLNKEALAIATVINHKKEQARCLNNIGLALWKFDNFSGALDNLFKALSISEQLHDLSDQSDILSNIGLVYIEIGDYDSAEKYLNTSINIDYRIDNPNGIYINRLNLGSMYRRLFLIKKDESFIEKALANYNNILSDVNSRKLKMLANINIASLYNDLGRFFDAKEYLDRALEDAVFLRDKENESIIYNNLGIILSNIGNFDYAITFHEKAIELATEQWSGQILWDAYLELANAYKKKGNEELAIENYKNSIAIIEDIRSKLNLEEYKATYLGTDKRLDAYYKLIDLLIKKGIRENDTTYFAEAFNYLERARARAFLDSLEISKVTFNEGVSQTLRYREVEIMNDISNLYTKLLNPELSEEQKKQISQKLDAAEQQLEALKREIRMSSPAYANLRYPEFITANVAQKNIIPANTLVIAYLLSSDASYAFALTKKSLKVHQISSVNEVREKVRQYLKALTDQGNSDFALGHELYKLLVEPVLNHEIKRIVVIPDDILHFLPFETLRINEAETKNWLVENYSISYAPSLTSLKEIIERERSQRQKPKKTLLAVGDPSFKLNGEPNSSAITLKSFYEPGVDITLERLKFGREEVDRIASYFPAKKRELLLSEEASEEKIKSYKLDQFRVVHFATHCLIDDRKPARSSIVLRLDEDPQEDGLLQMREIFNLKFNARLVTLSACQTAFGPFIRGEGLEGLSRAFFYAGASSLILSLWPINDQATSQLMDRFYYHLKSHQSVEKALQRAKLELINSTTLSHPYYWAGFIADGNTSKVIIATPPYGWAIVVGGLIMGAFFLIWLRNGHNGPKSKPARPPLLNE